MVCYIKIALYNYKFCKDDCVNGKEIPTHIRQCIYFKFKHEVCKVYIKLQQAYRRKKNCELWDKYRVNLKLYALVYSAIVLCL